MSKLTVVSDNPDFCPDFCGTWNKDEVVAEMKELGIEAPEDQWLDYIFDRNFECDSLADTVNFLKSGYVQIATITAMISGHSTTICYHK